VGGRRGGETSNDQRKQRASATSGQEYIGREADNDAVERLLARQVIRSATHHWFWPFSLPPLSFSLSLSLSLSLFLSLCLRLCLCLSVFYALFRSLVSVRRSVHPSVTFLSVGNIVVVAAIGGSFLARLRCETTPPSGHTGVDALSRTAFQHNFVSLYLPLGELCDVAARA